MREVIHSSALDLIQALKAPHPSTPLQVGHEQLCALETLANFFLNTSSEKDILAPPRVSKYQTKGAQRPFGEISLPRVPTLNRGTNRYHPAPKHAPVKPPQQMRTLPQLPQGQHYPPTRQQPTTTTPRQQRACHVATVVNPTTVKPAIVKEQPFYPKIANHVLCEDTGKIHTYRSVLKTKHKPTWVHSFSNELGRLMKGVGDRAKHGTETMRPIKRSKMPKGRKATYAKVVVNICPQKQEVKQSRLVVGGDKIDYPLDVSTKTVELETTKIFLNSVISTPNALFMGIDIKDFYLGTPLKRYEYIRLNIKIIPQEIINQYNLNKYVDNERWVYFEISKGMYGLPQAGRLAYEQLVKHLADFDYAPTTHNPGLWKHKTRPISFILWVDDFDVKYTNPEDVIHLKTSIEKMYKITMDWKGKTYVNLTLKWDYDKRTIKIALPGCVKLALERFKHAVPARGRFTASLHGSKIW